MAERGKSVIATVTLATEDVVSALKMASAITVVRCDEAAGFDLEVDGINDKAAAGAFAWLIAQSKKGAR